MKIAVIAGLGTTIGSIAMLYSFQTRLIFPGAASQGRPEAIVVPQPGIELVDLKTKQGDRVAALFAPALDRQGNVLADAGKRPTLLYFYGNGMFLKRVAEYDLEAFRRLGVNMMVPDYVGYGMSGGAPSEAGCYATAEACLTHLKTRKDVDPDKIVVLGRSLGGAVAIDLASREKVAGLVAFSTFTSMADMTRRVYKIPGLTLLLRHRFESLKKVSKVACPILLGHGDFDGLVPASMSRQLAKAATGKVTHFEVAGADHNDFYQVGTEQIVKELQTFLDAVETKPN